ncbi:MAG: hypothetical protein ACKO96_10300 [Flammeovirgaceae bacterium]
MDNGLPVDKLISWKAEETLTILNNLEEDLILLDQLYIGEVTITLINIQKLQNLNQLQAELGLMIFILMVFIGIAKFFIHMLTLMLIEFYKLIIPSRAIGKDHN